MRKLFLLEDDLSLISGLTFAFKKQGFVGSASVFALMQSGLFTEIVLIDADKNKAEGEAE